MAKKKTTEELIENLARMTQIGFSAVDARFDKMEIRFDKMDARFNKMEKEFGERFDRLEFHMMTHERRIEILEDKVRLISTKVGLKK